MQLWAADHKSVVETAGSIGFGRPCVGIIRGDHYISFSPTHEYGGKTYGDGCPEDVAQILRDTAPSNAYHKGDYFAVCYHEVEDNPELAEINRLAAMDELMKWWEEAILANRLAIKVVDSKPDSLIQAALTGTTVPIFVREGDQ
jgi:hypothetical protein